MMDGVKMTRESESKILHTRPVSIRPPLGGHFLARGVTLQWSQKGSYEFCGVKISTANWSQKDDLRVKNDSL